MKIKIKKLHKDAVVPVYAHGPEEDAGMDLRASELVFLHHGVPTLVSTGLVIELPPGYEGQIRSRSGLALKEGITVMNSPGTIDPSYRGEIKVILLWDGHHTDHSKVWDGGRFLIEPGDRIAQLVVAKYEAVEWVEDEEALSETTRGEGGFGSTGRL
jgi:dUTP pyrophosphatase